jgi:hypothetical protein
MIVVSLVTPAPRDEVSAGAFSFFGGDRATIEPSRAGWYADYRLWASILFVLVTALWYVFA